MGLMVVRVGLVSSSGGQDRHVGGSWFYFRAYVLALARLFGVGETDHGGGTGSRGPPTFLSVLR